VLVIAALLFILLLRSKEHAVMNALDFVFAPHNYLPDSFPFPFTVPATSSSSLITTLTDVATVTTPAVAIPTEEALATDALSTYNTSTPFGFLLYLVAQLQQIFVSGSAGGIFFGGPTRSYWMLTLFMVIDPIPYFLLTIYSTL
jgi:hypothetical protein